MKQWILTSALMIGFGAALLTQQPSSADESPASTQPTTEPSKLPDGVEGKWLYSSVGGPTYWNAENGAYMGMGHGNTDCFVFSPDGTYHEYVYIEMRTYSLLTTYWTTQEGTAEFTDGDFTIHPTRGHYKTAGSRSIDRDMTADELKKNIRTYHWSKQKTDDGKPQFVITFDDQSEMRFNPEEE